MTGTETPLDGAGTPGPRSGTADGWLADPGGPLLLGFHVGDGHG
ncbi:MAG TPA: hypothetical protein VFM55_26775 [Micromonosporaceae bacterium]|nr:hypothetical protein [Micromonosporaceae bacterium]